MRPKKPLGCKSGNPDNAPQKDTTPKRRRQGSSEAPGRAGLVPGRPRGQVPARRLGCLAQHRRRHLGPRAVGGRLRGRPARQGPRDLRRRPLPAALRLGRAGAARRGAGAAEAVRPPPPVPPARAGLPRRPGHRRPVGPAQRPDHLHRVDPERPACEHQGVVDPHEATSFAANGIAEH